MAGIDSEQYIAEVRARAAEGADPINLVGVAVTVGHELTHAGDLMLERVVHEAHQAGYSWTQIGDQLGISRQAARQRFAPGPMQVLDADMLEVLPRLQACLDRAVAEGQEDGSAEIDTQYLLLGLLHIGVAAAALDRLGVTRSGVREAMRELFDEPPGPSERAPELSVDAEDALAGARWLAKRGNQPYVGTEHLLFCMALDPGSQARRVLNHLGVDAAAVKRELEGCLPSPPRRRRRRDTSQACSFCGRTLHATRLVGGPGVCICEGCVQRAATTLSG